MTSPNDVIQRGYDSSGRPLKNTRRKWQAFDRINSEMGGKLVIVQGAFMGDNNAEASAGTHDLAGCNDVRRWNLTSAEARRVIQVANSVGDIWWERTYAQGFDPHFHNLLPNDHPLHPHAANQVVYFHRGENGLASHGNDTHHRPHPFPVFQYQEDDMFENDDRKELNHKLDRILDRVNAAFANERERDQADLQRHRRLTKRVGELVDEQGVLLNMLKDDDSPTTREVRRLLRQSRNKLLVELKEDPTTDGTVDDPSDEALEESLNQE